jgi:hypothetical protein
MMVSSFVRVVSGIYSGLRIGHIASDKLESQFRVRNNYFLSVFCISGGWPYCYLGTALRPTVSVFSENRYYRS